MSGDIYKDDDDVKDFNSNREIWDTLRAIDIAPYIETRNAGGSFKPSYISWANALLLVTNAFPEFEYNFDDDEYIPDGSVMVSCDVNIGEFSRSISLPVMDNRFKAIQNPNARDISDARMRCLAKAIACLGLGLQLYSGEDIPASVPSNSPPAPVAKEDKEKYTVAATALLALIEEETELDNLRAFWGDNKKVLADMEVNAKDVFKSVLSQFKAKAEELQKGTE